VTVIHSIRFGDGRMPLKRYTFVVYCEKDGDNVRVVAVLDTARDPTSIQSFLTERKNQPNA